MQKGKGLSSKAQEKKKGKGDQDSSKKLKKREKPTIKPSLTLIPLKLINFFLK